VLVRNPPGAGVAAALNAGIVQAMTPYEQIADLAADVQSEGYAAVGQALMEAHNGIFNGTELFMAWRFQVARALEHPLSGRTRAKAQKVWRMLDSELS